MQHSESSTPPALTQSQTPPLTEQNAQQPQSLFSNSKLFNQTLSKMTSRYIQSKILVSPKQEDLKKLDLRHMCDTVVKELEIVEKDAAYDYIKVSDELKQLSEEIQNSDEIMEELEDVLCSFRDHLQSIKSEMTTLQERSIKMNTSLGNRKKLQKVLLGFVESAVLDKELIDAICLNQIDETYVESIKALLQKLNYLKNVDLAPDARAVKELQPELEKLKAKASQRLRKFLIDNLESLKKPKTNIQVLQKNVLCKYKVFTEFLKEHYLSIYVEVCNHYRDIMAKIYLGNFTNYVSETYKLLVELYVKTDTVLPSDISLLRTFLPQTKPTSLNQEKRSIFYSMGRQKVVQSSEEDLILANIANQKGQKFTMEQVFKTVNRLLMDSVIFEVVFTADFFNVKSDQAIKLFYAIFRPSLNLFLKHLKDAIDVSYDIYGILLLIAINEKNRKVFTDKNLTALDFYFDQVNMVLWPRFQKLFETNLEVVKKTTPKLFKQMEKQAGSHVLVMRYVDFIIGLHRVYAQFIDSNKMLTIRISDFRTKYLELLKGSCREGEKQFDAIASQLKILDYIYSQFSKVEIPNAKKQFYDEIALLQLMMGNSSDKIVQIYLKELFGNLFEFVTKYSKDYKVSEANFDQNKELLSVPSSVDASVPQAIVQDISQNLNKKIETLKSECDKEFVGWPQKTIVSKFIVLFMNHYNAFYKYVKSAHTVMMGSLLPPHNMMKELKTTMKKYIQ